MLLICCKEMYSMPHHDKYLPVYMGNVRQMCFTLQRNGVVREGERPTSRNSTVRRQTAVLKKGINLRLML